MKLTLTIIDATLEEVRDLLGSTVQTPAVEVQTPAVEVQTPAPEAEPEAEEKSVLEALRAEFKETKTAGVDGGPVKAGDEVVAKETGQVFAVVATFRGYLCVEDEAGDQHRFAADALQVAAQEDTAPEQDLESARKAMREKARGVLEAHGAAAVTKAFKDACGARNVSEVPPEAIQSVMAELDKVNA